ncbi:divalent-cation tolerance protein CutA [Leeia sp.]|uniref:divalent-cation tolerance protein CutA n=1 Tax=Leeia sp. TaxID=2884678 RepID=UPI0035B2B87B
MTTLSTEGLLVLCNIPANADPAGMAQLLVEEQLAACINLLPPVRSFYRWQAQVVQDEETPLLIKTTQQAYPALEKRLQALHPYELPEIIAVPICKGLPTYLTWMVDSVKAFPE